jgi:hypothetical protein
MIVMKGYPIIMKEGVLLRDLTESALGWWVLELHLPLGIH